MAGNGIRKFSGLSVGTQPPHLAGLRHTSRAAKAGEGPLGRHQAETRPITVDPAWRR